MAGDKESGAVVISRFYKYFKVRMVVLTREENNLLVIDQKADKEINLSVRNRMVTTFDMDLLTFYKRRFQFKRTKHISEGMNIFAFLDRDFLDTAKIDKDAFLSGISVYQEFDEDEGESRVYFHGFDSENLSLLEGIFQNLGVGVETFQEGSFVGIVGEVPSPEEIQEQVEERKTEEKVGEIFSFLFGVSLIYGDFDIDEEVLHSVKMHIPLAGSLAGKEGFFDSLLEWLGDRSVLNKIDFLEQKIGFMAQIVLLDDEVLQSFVNFLDELDIASLDNGKRNKFNEFKKGIENFLEEEGYSFDERLRDSFREGILKVRRK